MTTVRVSFQCAFLYSYKGEIGFFDFYIIPLAKKLRECGVFGVSSDEYLTYAESNRNEWESRGEEVVKEISARAKENYERQYGSGDIGSNAISMDHSDKAVGKPLLSPPSNTATLATVRSSYFKTQVLTDSETTYETTPFDELSV